MELPSQPRIFISYSHRGKGPQWKEALLRALHVFEQHHQLDIWQDGRIRVSSFWDGDIKKAMAEASLAVLLLTPEALESEYITSTEFPMLRQRQQRDKLSVFPVICEECEWREYDWLRATQAPNSSNPLTQLPEAMQERIFRQLATDIAEELSRGALGSLAKHDHPLSTGQIYLDKFPLTRSAGLHEERLIGREQEIALLGLAFAQPHTAIVSLVAWGGVGKTMLVQHWLRRLQSQDWFGTDRVYAWSFFSQGTKEDRQASEDTFLAHALAWFGVPCEPTVSPWDKGRLLADAVARERTLLILDGIEPLQYPPGPMGGQLRAPGVQSLLKHLARKANSAEHHGLCLVTTREPLTDLADFERRPGSAWGSVLRVDLGNLTEEAGAVLLHHAGAKRAGAAEIKADDNKLLAASREVGGHALTLNLLGRFLARAHSGDIRRRDMVKFEEADRREQGGTTFKMLAAFENWFNRSGGLYQQSLAALRMLGLFDRPADAGCIATLRNPPAINGLTDPLFMPRIDATDGSTTIQPLIEEDWRTAISFLSDFGLVVIQAGADDGEHLIDCHPLIREYFSERLRIRAQGGWRLAHRRLYEYLRDTTADQPYPTLGELQPLYQAATHGCHAGLYSESLEHIYWRRIQRRDDWYGWKKVGAAGSELQLFSCFCEDNWTRVHRELAPPDAAFLLNQVGLMLRSQGRLQEAIAPISAAIRLHSANGALKQAAAGYSNLSETILMLGTIDESIRLGVKSVNLADESRDLFQSVHDRTTLSTAMFAACRLSEADETFSAAENLQRLTQPQLPRLYALRSYRLCDFLAYWAETGAWAQLLDLDVAEAAGLHLSPCRKVQERAEASLQIGIKEHWLLDVALDHLMLGRICLFRVILDHTLLEQRAEVLMKAKIHFAEAADALGRAGDAEYRPICLQSRAWLRILEGDVASAQADLDEAWDIAERGPMRLHMADIHLYRARLFFRRKSYPWESPQADLAAAEKLINECGYHRRDEELADAKRAILGA